jgi:hypothetical protein
VTRDWLKGFGAGLLAATLGALLGLWASPAKAEVVTEFGGGWKSPYTTSLVMREYCHSAMVIETRPDHPEYNYLLSSCGGDNPVFVGWPVAWQSEFSDVWTIRAGWFHLSHWFDGNADREVHMDCACATVTFSWSEWRRGTRREQASR